MEKIAHIINLDSKECKKHFPLSGDYVYYVVSGALDVFICKMQNGKPCSQLKHFYQALESEICYGFDINHEDSTYGLYASSLPNSHIIQVQKSDFLELVKSDSYIPFAMQINKLALNVNKSLSLHHALHDYEEPVFKEDNNFKPGTIISTRASLNWLKLTAGSVSYYDNEQLIITAPTIIPLSSNIWVKTISDVTLTTHVILEQEDYVHAFNKWFEFIYNYSIIRYRLLLQREQQRLDNLHSLDQLQLSNSLQSFNSLFIERHGQTSEYTSSTIYNAMSIIAQHLDTPLTMPTNLSQLETIEGKVEAIAFSSELKSRKVSLHPGWQEHLYGSLLVFGKTNQRPYVALLENNDVILYDSNGKKIEYQSDVIEHLELEGYYFYKPFGQKKLSYRKIFNYALREIKPDLVRVFAMGSLAGLLALVIPIATGITFDSIIPMADIIGLWQVVFAIIASAIAIGIFELSRDFILLRIEGKLESIVQSGIWDRLLKLPVPFFRKYTAGDLADRTSSFSKAMNVVSTTTIQNALTAIFSFYSLIVLFYYSHTLATILFLLTLILSVIVSITIAIKYKSDKKFFHLNGKIIGELYSFINGIIKIRECGAESRVFSKWSKDFIELKKTTYRSQYIENILNALNEGYYLIVLILVFFATYYFSLQEQLTAGDFLAFYAALNIFVLSFIQLVTTTLNSTIVIPILKRATPIIEAEPETDLRKSDPGILKGAIEIDNLCFRYADDGPLILDKITMNIEAGKFVAIVGPSGSGKSTLLRLLLGFEEASDGLIYYDNHDLSGINITRLRRQIGVVLQSSDLLPGTIFSNIVGESTLTLENAMSVIKQVHLENDINAMPMKLFTFVGEEGGSLSGGQKQRILIARALVHKPSILFLDEATSALDNESQQVITKSLKQIKSTKLVIAHRLSTIKNADTIFVIDKGKLVEQGTYKSLMNKQGKFYDLSNRQLL